MCAAMYCYTFPPFVSDWYLINTHSFTSDHHYLPTDKYILHAKHVTLFTTPIHHRCVVPILLLFFAFCFRSGISWACACFSGSRPWASLCTSWATFRMMTAPSLNCGWKQNKFSTIYTSIIFGFIRGRGAGWWSIRTNHPYVCTKTYLLL